MESVYFYEEDVGKEINEILQRYFKKVPYVIKECELLDSDLKDIFYMFAQGQKQ